jgi:hypothetical protein
VYHAERPATIIEGCCMLWVTRSRIRVNRAATGWLIRRFIDPGARFCFAEPEEVARIQRDRSAIGFDAPGARYPHKDGAGRCSFEVLVEEYRPFDRALRRLAQIVHCADFPDETAAVAPSAPGSFDVVSSMTAQSVRPALPIESVGLRAISRGFPFAAADDHETLDRSGFLYDALYASLQERAQ